MCAESRSFCTMSSVKEVDVAHGFVSEVNNAITYCSPARVCWPRQPRRRRSQSRWRMDMVWRGVYMMGSTGDLSLVLVFKNRTKLFLSLAPPKVLFLVI
jgi:hypothetical protein